MKKRDTSNRNPDESEKLLIFGNTRARKGAELKIKSSIESKCPGKYTKDLKDIDSRKRGFDTSIIYLKDSAISYALGWRKISSRKFSGI